MIPLYSTKIIRKVDDYAIKKLGIPGIILMENAALEVFKFGSEELKKKNKSGQIGFICGKGNNSGDGFAAARHFFNQGYKISVLYLFSESEMTQDCRTNFIILKNLLKNSTNSKMVKYSSVKDLYNLKLCVMVIDAMLGTGVEGDLREPYKSIINKVNTSNYIKLALDIPTGLDVDKGYSKLSYHADMTVTLGELKPGLFFGDGYTFAGKIKKGSIGLNQLVYNREKTRDFLIEPKDVLNSIPRKARSINKYSAGKVLTIAGSGKYPGAAVLTAKSCLKVGVGASILCFPKSVRNFVHKNLAEVVLREYDDEANEFLRKKNLKEISDRLEWADVVALGPGLGREEETQLSIIQLLEEKRFHKIVIDADGLFPLGNKVYKKIKIKDFILTPHHGEFCSLLGIELDDLRKDIIKYGREFVKETGAYLVLKGAPTIIFLPSGNVLINTVGNPGLAKFGSGDVLTGVISGFLSQIRDTKKALIAGIYIHSLAADLLIKKFTELGFTATDLINNISTAIRTIRNSID